MLRLLTISDGLALCRLYPVTAQLYQIGLHDIITRGGPFRSFPFSIGPHELWISGVLAVFLTIRPCFICIRHGLSGLRDVMSGIHDTK